MLLFLKAKLLHSIFFVNFLLVKTSSVVNYTWVFQNIILQLKIYY